MVEPDSFSSTTNNNYSKLEKLLKTRNWGEADYITLAIMLEATNREEEGWLELEHFQKLSDSELNTINQLWVSYSNGYFGFSVQKTIWEKSYNQNFLWEVGWFELSNNGSQGKFDFQIFLDITAPQGHFPRCILINFVKRLIKTHHYQLRCWSWGMGSYAQPKETNMQASDYYLFNKEYFDEAYKDYVEDLKSIFSHQYLR